MNVRYLGAGKVNDGRMETEEMSDDLRQNMRHLQIYESFFP